LILVGCGNPAVDNLLNRFARTPPEQPQGTGGAGGGSDAGASGGQGSSQGVADGGAAAGGSATDGAAGTSGTGGAAGSAGADASGSAGASGEIAACGALALSSSLQLAPAAPGQGYQRCDTLGPEAAWQVTLSPDGRRIAARTGAGTLRLVATDSWREIAQIASPVGRIDAVAFSPDGASLAALSAEMGEVTIWNSADGSLARTFAGPPASTIDAYASSLAYSSDGTRLATSLGTVIDLASGAATDWTTGMPVTATSTVNPENLSLGQAIPRLAFTAANARLFVDTEYQVGNSPPSTRLSLRAPATGQETVLFNAYSRALNGFALSPDGRQVALAITVEAQAAGFAAGLVIYAADTGAPGATDPSFTGSVLGFSHDGDRLFTLTGSTVGVVATADLHPIAQFAWPAGSTFLGVSPDDALVGSDGSTTSWLSSSTGAVVHTLAAPLTAVTWSSDGRFGAGTGDPAALFHFWREADVSELCAPPPQGPPAPSLASLGTLFDPSTAAPSGSSDDGTIIITNDMTFHTHASDWTALHVRDAAGNLLRVFGATSLPRPIAISRPSGARLYTSEGPDVAVWCR
jgi:WD40 repeat protein